MTHQRVISESTNFVYHIVMALAHGIYPGPRNRHMVHGCGKKYVEPFCDFPDSAVVISDEYHSMDFPSNQWVGSLEGSPCQPSGVHVMRQW